MALCRGWMDMVDFEVDFEEREVFCKSKEDIQRGKE